MKNTILLADDNETLLKTYSAFLEKRGFEVFTAIDGENAINVIKDKEPAMLILDLNMPKVTGLEVTQKVRGTPYGQHLPIIILTGNQPDDKIINDIMEANPSYYIIKGSISIDELCKKITNTMNEYYGIGSSATAGL